MVVKEIVPQNILLEEALVEIEREDQWERKAYLLYGDPMVIDKRILHTFTCKYCKKEKKEWRLIIINDTANNDISVCCSSCRSKRRIAKRRQLHGY